MAHSLLHFLEVNGAVHTIVNFAIMTLLGAAVKYVRDLIKHQRRTNDLLRTDTPGGNRDIVEAIRQKGGRTRTREH